MAHIHELIDWTVAVFIVHDNKVLLRLHDKYNHWLAVGGHVELDEDPAEAAARECMEEVGLEINIFTEDELIYHKPDELQELPRPASMNIHKVNDTHRHIDICYYATVTHTNITPENPSDQWKWLTKDEIEADSKILPSIKKDALGALETLRTK